MLSGHLSLLHANTTGTTVCLAISAPHGLKYDDAMLLVFTTHLPPARHLANVTPTAANPGSGGAPWSKSLELAGSIHPAAAVTAQWLNCAAWTIRSPYKMAVCYIRQKASTSCSTELGKNQQYVRAAVQLPCSGTRTEGIRVWIGKIRDEKFRT